MEPQGVADIAEENKIVKCQRWSMDTHNVLHTYYEHHADNGALVKAIRGRHSNDDTLLFPGQCLHNGSC